MGENYWVMRYSQTTQCYVDEYNKYTAYAAVMVVLYPAGVPLLFFFVLYSIVRKQRLDDETTVARYGFLCAAPLGNLSDYPCSLILNK